MMWQRTITYLGLHGCLGADVGVHNSHGQPDTGHHLTGQDVLVHHQLLMPGGHGDALTGGDLARLQTEAGPVNCQGGFTLKVFVATFLSFYFCS